MIKGETSLKYYKYLIKKYNLPINIKGINNTHQISTIIYKDIGRFLTTVRRYTI